MSTYRKAGDKSRIAIIALVAILGVGFVICQPALAANNGNGNNGNGNNGNGNLSADSQSVVIDENSSVEITLTGSGPNGFTYEIATSPTHGTLTGTAPNMLYTPDADYFGTDSFTFHTHKGGNDSPDATVSITVNEVIVDPPLATTSCDEGYHLEAEICVPDVIEPPVLTCDEGYHVDNNSCVLDHEEEDPSNTITCDEGYHLENNTCVVDQTEEQNSDGNGSSDNGNGNNEQPQTGSSHHNWDVAIKFAERTENMDFTQVPESTSGLTLYQAINGPLGFNFMELLKSFELKDLKTSDLTQGQMVWLLEHFDELMK